MSTLSHQSTFPETFSPGCHESPAEGCPEHSARGMEIPFPVPGSRPPGRATAVCKRTLDLLGCVAALPLLLLCTLVMTIVTKLVSPGPVLFRQERVGYQGRRFKLYKFRSMHVEAETAGHQAYFKELVGSNAPMVKLDARGDARLLPGAWLLRATGLDELPQIINVLRGEMSLVGPRPCLPTEAELYQFWQRERFEVLPGLTGLWQVSGKNRTTFEEMVYLDIRYARTRAFWIDLRIMALTIPALLEQIYDTRTGRRSSAASAHTVAPFSMTRNQSPTRPEAVSPGLDHSDGRPCSAEAS
jgi:lipopolysaccharide/colanic/teichoic acid biosynthesis glycosyltransferase